MFITRPRAKKNALTAPPRKKRKAEFAIEEISFDDSARADYLTGFHKRKVQRQKQAQEVATEKARQEKIAFRKEMREQRQKQVEDHVRQVKDALKQARLAGGEGATDSEEDGEGEQEWGGFDDAPAPVPEFVDHEEEYVEEDKYTTVTVEAVDIDREGMHALSGRRSNDSDDSGADDDDSDGGKDGKTRSKQGKAGDQPADGKTKDKKEWPKKKKKKFWYESKLERQVSRMKQNRKR